MSPEPAPRRAVLSTVPIDPANPPQAPWPPDGMSVRLRLEVLAMTVVNGVLDQLDPQERQTVLLAIRDRYGDGS
jgi:hypothetical protein